MAQFGGKLKLSTTAVMLTWIFYVTTAELIWMFARPPLPTFPVAALEPFRIANRYGLFAVMTRGRYEIEFQGSTDGENWVAYPFRYKPQALNKLRESMLPISRGSTGICGLHLWARGATIPSFQIQKCGCSRTTGMCSNCLRAIHSRKRRRGIRVLLWQYWFTSMKEKRETGMWWRRKLLGLYAPVLEIGPDGKVAAVGVPEPLPPHE